MDMSTLETWEMWSYVVTVIALPLAIAIFIFEQHKERENEEEEAYQTLSNAYIDFLKVVMENPDLKLRSQTATPNLTAEQRERMLVIFDMLVSLFERAFLLLYEEKMPEKEQRRWNSWEDYMREWCRREDFRAQLPALIQGEDPEFAQYIGALAQREALGVIRDS